MDLEGRRGTKRRMPAVRPEVEAVVGLCALAERVGLNETQHRALDTLAQALGLPPGIPNPCPRLAYLLGDEWSETAERADALAQYVQDETRLRALAGLHEEARNVRARQSRTMAILPSGATRTLVPFEWEQLLPEVRAIVLERMAESDPATLFTLYRTDRDAHTLIDAVRRPILVADENGNLAERSVPLVQYAGLVLATGYTDPLDIFLRAALCTIMAAVDASEYGNEALLSGDLLALDIIPRGPDGNPSIAALVMEGLTEDQFDDWIKTDEGRRALEMDGRSEDALRDLMVGPLANNLADAVAAWWQWLARQGAPGGTIVGARYDALVGRPDTPRRTAEEWQSVMANAVNLGPTRPTLGTDRWRETLSLDISFAFALADGVVSATAVRAWLAAPLDARWKVTDDVQTAVLAASDAGTDLAAKAMRLYGATVTDFERVGPARGCRALATAGGNVDPASFGNLFAASEVWARPEATSRMVDLVIGFRSPALDEALHLARGRSVRGPR
jgi:hypothetical protein